MTPDEMRDTLECRIQVARMQETTLVTLSMVEAGWLLAALREREAPPALVAGTAFEPWTADGQWLKVPHRSHQGWDGHTDYNVGEPVNATSIASRHNQLVQYLLDGLATRTPADGTADAPPETGKD